MKLEDLRRKLREVPLKRVTEQTIVVNPKKDYWFIDSSDSEDHYVVVFRGANGPLFPGAVERVLKVHKDGPIGVAQLKRKIKAAMALNPEMPIEGDATLMRMAREIMEHHKEVRHIEAFTHLEHRDSWTKGRDIAEGKMCRVPIRGVRSLFRWDATAREWKHRGAE